MQEGSKLLSGLGSTWFSSATASGDLNVDVQLLLETQDPVIAQDRRPGPQSLWRHGGLQSRSKLFFLEKRHSFPRQNSSWYMIIQKQMRNMNYTKAPFKSLWKHRINCMYFSFQRRLNPKAQCHDCWAGHVTHTGLNQTKTVGRAGWDRASSSIHHGNRGRIGAGSQSQPGQAMKVLG